MPCTWKLLGCKKYVVIDTRLFCWSGIGSTAATVRSHGIEIYRSGIHRQTTLRHRELEAATERVGTSAVTHRTVKATRFYVALPMEKKPCSVRLGINRTISRIQTLRGLNREWFATHASDCRSNRCTPTSTEAGHVSTQHEACLASQSRRIPRNVWRRYRCNEQGDGPTRIAELAAGGTHSHALPSGHRPQRAQSPQGPHRAEGRDVVRARHHRPVVNERQLPPHTSVTHCTTLKLAVALSPFLKAHRGLC